LSSTGLRDPVARKSIETFGRQQTASAYHRCATLSLERALKLSTSTVNFPPQLLRLRDPVARKSIETWFPADNWLRRCRLRDPVARKSIETGVLLILYA